MFSTSTLKRCIYSLDAICTLLAAVLIGFEVYVILTFDSKDWTIDVAYAYMGIGISTFVVLLFITVGAARENVCCTVTFIILMVVVILGQLGVAYWLMIKQEDFASNLANTLDTAWEDEIKNPGAMSLYENWFECCGRASPQDYIVNDRLPPDTCFKNNDSSIPDNLIESGCRIKYENYWAKLLGGFNIIAWLLIAFEIVVVFVSCVLCNSIRNDRRRSGY